MGDANAVAALNAISHSNTNFTVDLYKVLANEPGNLFFSPLSIQVVLALVYFGAKGDTADELERGLHLPRDKQLTDNGINALMHQLSESQNVLLDIANRIYLRTGSEIKNEFKKTADRFLAGVEQINFAETEQARKTINNWIENKTNGKIKDIIEEGALDAETLMVLVNAIYFKGAWLKVFYEDETKPTPFHLSSGTTEDVDMMYVEDHFQYVDLTELNTQALMLPYKDWNLNMVVLLPKEVNGLQELERNLDKVDVSDIVKRMTNNNVFVYLPKFKMEYFKTLKDTLITLGMESMFNPAKANFSGIVDEKFVVSKVLHKAFIEVNENGTEAAAATVLITEGASFPLFPPPPPVIFKADHPFIFFIVDEVTGTILFAGRFVKSSA
ncbi:leukocyte elastase inhibitor-like isoform X2 [Schistocerca cancellata]|uniref:leukocyte elastase inhibitor-like isoform X2 n=1 Tax=Schistocerca cancellata TaxID=274614 RepID=UPI0021190EAA|nr:leukocyte elastase inhibitor-like isoform X2 [Schistocerca cancellata]